MKNRPDTAPPDSAPAPLLPAVSIVEQTMDHARRTLARALAGAAVLICALQGTHIWLDSALDSAAERHAQAQRVAGAVKLANHQLTANAQMAVATGDYRFVHEHDAQLPLLELALAQARELAPPQLARRFDAETRLAHEELANLRESAFDALERGDRATSASILQGQRYRENAALLSNATGTFADATVAAARDVVEGVQRRSAIGVTLVMTLAAGCGLVLWRGLARRLAGSRRHFLEAEDRIHRLASSDLLTGLSNRTALHDAMALALGRVRDRQQGLAVLMIDLDRFKPVNDRHGHMVGDLVLKEVAQRLRRCLRGGELQARYGGDEFVVAIEERGHPDAARVVGERIVAAISQPMLVDGQVVAIGASIGIARFPVDAETDDELLRRADSALYRAKTAGRGRVCFYDATLDAQVAERATLEQQMRDGIANGEFVPYYQPIVDLATREVQSLELLCRWKHPQRGLVPPQDFIPLAEDTGLIGPMTLAVLHRACRDMARWPAAWRLSINLAPQQMLDPGVVPQLLAVLAEHGVPPPRLDVELTETALVSDTARAREVMMAMKAAGLTVTLDDFGTGYSSLSYLAELRFDKIKIDRSFVRTLHERPESAKIVDAVVGLSRSLGVPTVAEGVETERDAAALLALGCALAQGYLFGRPVPADELKLPQPAPVRTVAA